jgi:flagellar biosynthesis protein FlhB
MSQRGNIYQLMLHLPTCIFIICANKTPYTELSIPNCIERVVLCFLWTTVSKVDGTKGFLNALKTRDHAKDCSDTLKEVLWAFKMELIFKLISVTLAAIVLTTTTNAITVDDCVEVKLLRPKHNQINA